MMAVEHSVVAAVAQWFRSIQKDARFSRTPSRIEIADQVKAIGEPASLNEAASKVRALHLWVKTKASVESPLDVHLKLLRKTREVLCTLAGLRSRRISLTEYR